MQLFTIGLLPARTPTAASRLVDGAPVDTYGLDDVTGLARVFTGWDFDIRASDVDGTRPDFMRRPMAQVASRHETGAKTFLGTTMPAGTDGARRR